MSCYRTGCAREGHPAMDGCCSTECREYAALERELDEAVRLLRAVRRYVEKAAPSGAMWADEGGLADQIDAWLATREGEEER